MITLTAIRFLLVFLLLDARRQRQDFDRLGIVGGAVVVQAPRCGIARLAFLDAHDDVAIPRPGMIAVVFAGTCGRIGMRMIPPDQLQFLLAGRLFRRTDVVGGPLEPVSRRIVPPIGERQQVNHLTRTFPIASKQRTAAFVRVGFHTMRMDPADHIRSYLEGRHAHCSLQNRSLKYFSPESGNTVTITAGRSRLSRRAISRHAHSAPPALTPTSRPSSRASCFAIRCASSVSTSIFSSARLAS